MAISLLLGLSALLIVTALWLTAAGLWRCWQTAGLERGLRRLELEVKRREDHGAFVRLILATPGSARRLPAYRAGDYLMLRGGAARPQQRCYSLAGWQARPWHYELVIKREPGGVVSNWAHAHLYPGTRVNTSIPRGAFHLSRGRHGVHVLVAAGVGITPMRAMLQEHLARTPKRPVALFWTVRELSELMLYHQEFEQLAHHNRAFSYAPSLTGDASGWHGGRGRLTARDILDRVGGVDAIAGIWMCASPQMHKALGEELLTAGLPSSLVHTETFSVAPPAQPCEHPVHVYPAGRSLLFDSQPSVLHLLDSAGIPLNSECRTGSCGRCKIRLRTGDAEWVIPPGQALAEGIVLACCVRPRSALEIEVF